MEPSVNEAVVSMRQPGRGHAQAGDDHARVLLDHVFDEGGPGAFEHRVARGNGRLLGRGSRASPAAPLGEGRMLLHVGDDDEVARIDQTRAGTARELAHGVRGPGLILGERSREWPIAA